MRTTLLALILVLSAQAFALAQETTIAALRSTTRDFYRGSIHGAVNAYVGFMSCPRPISSAMVEATIDAIPRRFEDDAFTIAVLKIMVIDFNCAARQAARSHNQGME